MSTGQEMAGPKSHNAWTEQGSMVLEGCFPMTPNRDMDQRGCDVRYIVNNAMHIQSGPTGELVANRLECVPLRQTSHTISPNTFSAFNYLHGPRLRISHQQFSKILFMPLSLFHEGSLTEGTYGNEFIPIPDISVVSSRQFDFHFLTALTSKCQCHSIQCY